MHDATKKARDRLTSAYLAAALCGFAQIRPLGKLQMQWSAV
jgi:hypothetical protein